MQNKYKSTSLDKSGMMGRGVFRRGDMGVGTPFIDRIL
jgi:hypothetical protein